MSSFTIVAVLGIGLALLPYITHGVKLPDCQQNLITVDETKTTEIVCLEIGSSEANAWKFDRPGDRKVIIGFCPTPSSGACLPASLFTMSRTETSSTLTIPSNSNSLRTIGDYSVRCAINGSSSACQLNVIYPSEVSDCRVSASAGTWMVEGSCDITKTYASRTQTYKCVIYRGTSQATQSVGVVSAGYSPTPHTDADYVKGSCTFNDSLPIPSGQASQDYYYKIIVDPGSVELVRGPVTVARPSQPTLSSCSSSEYVRENSSISCSCSTTNLGTPTGRLQWYQIKNTQRTALIATGDYGVDSLTMSLTLQREDHEATSFRCIVDWAVSVAAGNDITFRVEYKPDKTRLSFGSSASLEKTVSEKSDVLLTCQADARPEALVVLYRGRGTEIATGWSPFSHTLTDVTCTDAGTYRCVASNQFGQADTAATVQLFVSCSPRTATSADMAVVNFRNQTVSLVLSLVAYPEPRPIFVFSFTGKSGTDAPFQTRDIQLSAACQPQGGASYLWDCTVTVHDVSSPRAAGFYTVTVFNDVGSSRFPFQLLWNDDNGGPETDSQQSRSSDVVVELALGVPVAVVTAVLLLAVLWLWWRKWVLPCAQSHGASAPEGSGRRNIRPSPPTRNSLYDEVDDLNEDRSANIATGASASGRSEGQGIRLPLPARNSPSPPYDDVIEIREVASASGSSEGQGIRLPLPARKSSTAPYDDISEIREGLYTEPSEYEGLRSQEIGTRSVYSGLTARNL